MFGWKRKSSKTTPQPEPVNPYVPLINNMLLPVAQSEGMSRTEYDEFCWWVIDKPFTWSEAEIHDYIDEFRAERGSDAVCEDA